MAGPAEVGDEAGRGAGEHAVQHLRLAPAAILRAAAWPRALLDGLGDPALAELAVRGGVDLRERYDQVLARERGALYARTVGDRAFARALVVSNPEVWERARGRLGVASPRTKRIRHLETTLYRYLARAVGRSDPCDLWAGVALVSFGERTHLDAVPPVTVFAPDLACFQALLSALASREEYRRRAPLAASPTLVREPDGAFTFWTVPGLRGARAGETGARRRRLKAHPAASVILEVASRAAPLRVDALARRAHALLEEETAADWSVGQLEELALELLDAGALIGGLALPARFRSPWQALRIAARWLSREHRAAWARATAGLWTLSSTLGAGFAELGPEDVAVALARARGVVERLAAELQVEGLALPRVVLRADLRLGVRVSLGPEVRARLEEVAEEYERHQARLGLARPLRASLRARLEGLLGRDGLPVGAVPEALGPRIAGAGPRSWQELAAAIGAGPAVEGRLAELEAALGRGGARVVLSEADGCSSGQGPRGVVTSGRSAELAAPLGALLVSIPPPGGGNVSVHGMLDEVAAPHARFAWVLAGSPRAYHTQGQVAGAEPRQRSGVAPPVGEDRVLTWIQGELRRLGGECGLELLELARPWPDSPNALARPRYLRRAIAPWSVGQGMARLRGLRISLDGGGGAPLLFGPGSERPMVAWSFVAAPFSLIDPVARVLLLSSFQDGPVESMQASAVAYASELRGVASSPRLELPREISIRPRRLTVSGAELAALLRLRGADRFVAFQHLAHTGGLGRLLSLRRDGGAPLLIVRDSPLALEAALEGAGETRVMTLEELPEDLWLELPGVGRVESALALPFAREVHTWSRRARTWDHRGER